MRISDWSSDVCSSDLDYSLTLPPPPPPPSADGAIFQADAGYAALYEGWKARRVGDPLTIVLVERTVASKSSTSQLDSKGQFGLIPPTDRKSTRLNSSH